MKQYLLLALLLCGLKSNAQTLASIQEVSGKRFFEFSEYEVKSWASVYEETFQGLNSLVPQDGDIANISTQEERDEEKFEQWEHVMRSLPVQIIRIAPESKFLSVTIKKEDVITFCEKSHTEIVFSIKNEFDAPIPAFYFYPEYLNQGISLLKSSASNTSIICHKREFFIPSLKPGEEVKIYSTYVVDCDGNGGSPVLNQEQPSVKHDFGWSIEILGYLYNPNRGYLYKVFSEVEKGGSLTLRKKI